jgi:hypothetical protein
MTQGLARMHFQSALAVLSFSPFKDADEFMDYQLPFWQKTHE